MIHYIKEGDIFSIEGVTNYAHGCNCAGSMGRGIAVQFRKKLPRMYENYRQMCLNKTFRSGDVYDYDYGIGHVTEQRRAELLEGLDEYYASRRDLLNENRSHEKTKIINGLTYVVVDNMTVEEWAKQNDAIPIEDTFLRW